MYYVYTKNVVTYLRTMHTVSWFLNVRTSILGSACNEETTFTECLLSNTLIQYQQNYCAKLVLSKYHPARMNSSCKYVCYGSIQTGTRMWVLTYIFCII